MLRLNPVMKGLPEDFETVGKNSEDGEAKKLVDIVHEDGREAMMFLGDNWIGTEPYGKYFE